MTTVHAFHKVKNKKYTDVVLSVSGGNFCLASAHAAINFLCGETIPAVNIFWGECVEKEKIWKGFAATCRTFEVTDKECSKFHSWQVCEGYMAFKENWEDYLREMYQEDEVFLMHLDSYKDHLLCTK